MVGKKPVAREIIKWSFLVLIIVLSMLHIYGNKAFWAPLDAYCPFGALESTWELITQGNYLNKIQPSNLALGLALILTTIIFGGVFCGWICPLGTLQDGLNHIGRRLKIPQVKISAKLDFYLRLIRYIVLIVVVLEAFKLATLWFADYDPFRIIFGLHWISEPEKLVVWSWLIGCGFIILAIFNRRFWCKYFCPLGLIVQWMSWISFFRVRWNKSDCTNCNLCIRNCPLEIHIPNTNLNSTACNACQECISHCPSPRALQYKSPFRSGQTSALFGVGIFSLILLGAQIFGWWNPAIGSDPDSIKGWMTLEYLAKNYKVDLKQMKQDLKFPKTVNEDTELRSLESVIPGFETDIVRGYVASIKQGKPFTMSEPNHSPALGENAQGPLIVVDNQPKQNESGTTRDMVNESHNQTHSSLSEIKGSMSLQEISNDWDIALPVLVKKLGLPENIETTTPIKEYDEIYGISGSQVREVIDEILKTGIK